MSEGKAIKIDGFTTFKAHEKAPDFILGTLVVSLNKFFKFCKDQSEFHSEYNGEKQIRIKILSGQYGVNFQLDTYKPDANKNKPEDEPGESHEDDTLPF